jgi:hypothetical protein
MTRLTTDIDWSAEVDGNLPPVTLVRVYTKQPPPLEIPSLDSTGARGMFLSTNSPTAPSPSSAFT